MCYEKTVFTNNYCFGENLKQNRKEIKIKCNMAKQCMKHA